MVIEIFERECFNNLVSICETLIAIVESCRLTGGLRGSFRRFCHTTRETGFSDVMISDILSDMISMYCSVPVLFE